MSPATRPRKEAQPVLTNLLAGLLGGLIVLALGAILIAVGAIDTGDTKVVRGSAIERPATSDGSDGRTVSEIYRKEGRGVVFVEARGGRDQPSIFGLPREQGAATGSGFVVDRDGTIITNAHVVEGSSKVTVRFDEKDDPVDAQVKGRDPSSDLAVLKIDPKDAKGIDPLRLGNSKETRVGDPVVAIGNPFGFARSVTTGIVSAQQRQITAPNGFPIRNVIQTDASINPGNSGGPLLDADGKVIGINAQIATGGGRGSVGIAFAVPVDTAKSLLPQLRRGGKVERSYLGVEMAPVTKQVAEDLNLPVEDGALLQNVEKGGPAGEAGLRGGRTQTGEGVAAGGDVLVEVDGERIETPDDVAAAIADDRPGDEVEVVYYRGDEKRTATVKLSERPNRIDSSQAPGGGEGPIPLP